MTFDLTLLEAASRARAPPTKLIFTGRSSTSLNARAAVFMGLAAHTPLLSSAQTQGERLLGLNVQGWVL